jgi:hypothetical protein
LDRVLARLSEEMDDRALAAASGVSRSMVRAIRSACRLADERRAWPVRLPAGPGGRD